MYARKLLAAALIKNGEPARAATLLAAAAQDAPKDPQLMALAGESYMQAKDFAKASEYLQKASALAPQDAFIRTSLGKSRIGMGDTANAIADLEKAAALDPKSLQANKMLVLTFLQQGQLDKALSLINQLDKEEPNSAPLLHLRGAIHQAKRDLTAARADYEKALSVDPAHFPAVAALARLDIQDKKPELAKRRFEAVLAKDKKNVQAMAALGYLALSQNNNEEATQWLEKASSENPDAIQPATALAAHYMRIGQKQKALTLAKKLQATNPNSVDALELLAQVQFASDDKAAALESYEKVAAMVPSSAQVQFRIATINMAMQKQSAAADAIKKALALQPNYLDALIAQTGLETKKGNYEQALAVARSIQKQHPKQTIGHELEAEIQLAQKKPALAVKAYEQALAVNSNGALVIKMHRALAKSGMEKEANARVLKWLDEHPGDIAMRMYVGEAHLANAQYAQAIKQYEAVLKQDAQNVLALNNLAWAYQQAKDPRALQTAEKAYAANENNASVLDTLGWILVEKNETTRGVSLLQKAASLAPDASDIRYHLVLGLVKAGDKAKARSELEQLLATGKDFPNIKEARALLAQL